MPACGRLLVAAVALLLLGTVVAPTAAAAGSPTTADGVVEDRSAFIVELEPNGDATVSLTLTYDLDDENDEAAFDRLREDQTEVTDRFEERISRVANRTAVETGREMSVSDVQATVTRTDGTGVVRLSGSWTALAAVDGDRLVVAEPFASEFRPDRPFVLVAPDDHEIVETSVPPDATDEATAEWHAGTDLSEFAVTISPDDDVDETATGDSLPTPLVPTLALVATVLLGYAGWRRS